MAATLTKLALEEALRKTIALISQYQSEKTAKQSEINTLQADYDAKKKMYDSAPSFIKSSLTTALNAARDAVVRAKSQLTTIQANLTAALNQKIVDQEELARFNKDNMSAQELADFQDLAQDAAEHEQGLQLSEAEAAAALEQKGKLSKYKNQIFIGLGLLAFIVIVLIVRQQLKKRKLLKSKTA